LIESAGREEVPTREPEVDGPLIKGWTGPQIHERYATEHKEEMRRLWDFLADHPGEMFDMKEIAEALDLSVAKLNGILSGFSRINKRDYGTNRFPWRVVRIDGRINHGMPEEVAEIIRDARG
jgi:hypothetical protein